MTKVIPSVETLTGGTADTFVVCAGAGTPVQQLTAAQARTLLSVLTSSQIAAAYQPIGSYAAASHSHGAITNAGAIGSTADLLVGTGASGVLETKSASAVRTIAGLGTMSTRSTYQIQVALSGNGQNISAGTKKGLCRVPIAGTITGFLIVCDPANEPSAAAVQCDLNTLNLTTGAATSVLSSVASIATGANVSTGGAISGSPAVAEGDLLSIDIDQGSDGRELVATITITAT